MDYFEVEHRYYQTPAYDTEAEAWQDLMANVNPTLDDHWVWFRVPPEVNSEYLFDYKKTIYRGFARWVVNPKALGLNLDTIAIPTLGTAKEVH